MPFNSPLMQAIAQHDRDTVLLSDGEAISLNAGELIAAVNTLIPTIQALKTHGIALAMDNSPLWVIADLAALECGVWTLPLPPFFTSEQCQNALQRSGCSRILSDKPPAEDQPAGPIELLGKTLYFVALGSSNPSDQTQEGTAKVTFTSGSTGKPKGLCLSQAQLLDCANAVAQRSQTLGLKRHLSVLPLAVLLENVAGVYAALLAGVHCIVPSLKHTGMSQVSSAARGVQLATYLQQQDANSCILVPELLKGIHQAMADNPSLHLATLRFVAVGGAPVGAHLLTQCRTQGLPVYEGYGLSEASSVVTLNTPQAHRAGSVGQCLAHQQIHLTAEGEIQLDKAGFLGYCGEAPMAPAPFATGDLGRFDDEGFLFILGRKKHLLITPMGRNISPEWLESELTGHPIIEQAFVQQDAREQLSALIVSQATDAQISACVRQTNTHLPDYAKLTQWARVPAFSARQHTLTGNGKLKREAIARQHRAIERYNRP